MERLQGPGLLLIEALWNKREPLDSRDNLGLIKVESNPSSFIDIFPLLAKKVDSSSSV